MKNIAVFALVGALGLTSLSGCMATRAENGALIGGATGAAVGAVATRSVGGAVVGGGIGAIAGYLIGKNSYRCQKVNIFNETYWGTCFRK